MAAEQDWCLQCGAGARGGAAAAGWRSAATILGVTAVLALGAAAAGYAALNKKTHNPPVATTTVAQAPAAAVPATPVTPGAPTTIKPVLPKTAVKPPTIPLATSTPPATPTTTAKSETGASTTPAPSTGGASTEPTPILLDTNAASTYNPYNYPAANFGDPSLTIDGDTSTGWTALVDPATAPRLAEGVLIDVKTPRRFGSVKLATSSPGMSVELYGANGASAPTSIVDTAWVPLSHSRVVGKKHLTIKLRHSKHAFRFITLWISRAPAASVGTPEAPGHVSVNEIELFAPE
ncbi:MAG TPA: hypothetical protein VG366_07300 [Solirubrobacteraceae bacterium]|jgi:hypothetical protein|nr:hypothetical protein [Solirubrobacteraceae bacterium]